MCTPSKSVVYRGGIVTFQIPAAWREEYAPDGGGVFYEEGEDTGTLRLNVLSFEKKEATTPDAVLPDGGSTDVLPSGFQMRRYMTKGEERGTLLHLYRWEVLVPIPPSRYRLVCFSHTILAACEGSPRAKQELEIVDRLVHEADYSTAAGVIPKPKPWWKLW